MQEKKNIYICICVLKKTCSKLFKKKRNDEQKKINK